MERKEANVLALLDVGEMLTVLCLFYKLGQTICRKSFTLNNCRKRVGSHPYRQMNSHLAKTPRHSRSTQQLYTLSLMLILRTELKKT